MRTLPTRHVTAAAMLAVLGCTGERIEIVIEPQGGCESECGRAPLGCVESLRLYQYSDIGHRELRAGSVGPTDENHNLCSNRFAEALTTDVLDDVAHLEVWGSAPSPDLYLDPLPPAPIFVARGGYEPGADRIHLEARCALSCEAMHPWAHEKWLHDLVTGEVPAAVEAMRVNTGMVFDMRAFYPEQPEPDVRLHSFPVGDAIPRPEDGGVVLEGEIFDWPPELGHRCFAVRMYGDLAGRQLVCVEPEEPIVHVLDSDRHAIIQAWLEHNDFELGPWDGFFVGVVRNAAIDQPMRYAHVDAPAEARVLYPDFVEEWNPEASLWPETRDQGVFVVLGPYVGEITVRADGFHPITVKVAAVPGYLGSRVIHLAPLE